MKLKEVKAVQDGDCHWFVIPADRIEEFHRLLYDGELKDDYSEFEDQFGQYATGGDLNNIKLYADI